MLRHQVQVLMAQDACGHGATAELARSNRTVHDPTPQTYEPTGDFRTPPNKVNWAMAEFNGFVRQ